MSTSIDQAFIKQFECCSRLSNTTCNCSPGLNTVNNGAIRVVTVKLATVFELSCAVKDSGAVVRSNFPAVLNNLAETHGDFFTSIDDLAAFFEDV